MKPKGFKVLLLITAVLVAIIATFMVYDSTTSESNYRNILVEVDSAEVTKFVITAKAKKDIIEIAKHGNEWKVTANKKTYNADKQYVGNLINQLKMLKPQRVAATTPDTWKQYEVDDSSSAKLTVYEGTEVVANLVIGKFDFKQSPNPYARQMSVTSYVRMTGDNSVYAVDGMLSMAFMRGAEEYRDKTLARLPAADITKVSLTYPADSSFVIEKKQTGWTAGGSDADSIKVQNYMSQFANLSCYDFVDESSMTSKTPLFKVTIESTSTKPVEICAYPADTTHSTIVESNINKGCFFSGIRSGVQGRIFVSKASLLK